MKNKRYRQANKEALITLGVYLFFFLWWTLFAFGLGSGDPEEYSYVLGLPAWFFYSCVLGYPVVSVVLWIVVRLFFVDMPLDSLQAASGGASYETNEPDAGVSGALRPASTEFQSGQVKDAARQVPDCTQGDSEGKR